MSRQQDTPAGQTEVHTGAHSRQDSHVGPQPRPVRRHTGPAKALRAAPCRPAKQAASQAVRAAQRAAALPPVGAPPQRGLLGRVLAAVLVRVAGLVPPQRRQARQRRCQVARELGDRHILLGPAVQALHLRRARARPPQQAARSGAPGPAAGAPARLAARACAGREPAAAPARCRRRAACRLPGWRARQCRARAHTRTVRSARARPPAGSPHARPRPRAARPASCAPAAARRRRARRPAPPPARRARASARTRAARRQCARPRPRSGAVPDRAAAGPACVAPEAPLSCATRRTGRLRMTPPLKRQPLPSLHRKAQRACEARSAGARAAGRQSSRRSTLSVTPAAHGGAPALSANGAHAACSRPSQRPPARTGAREGAPRASPALRRTAS